MKNEDSLWLFKSYQKNSFHLDEFDTNKILTLKVELDGPGADNNEDRDGFDQFWHSFKCCSGSKMIGSGCGIIGDIYWVSLFLMYRILHNIYQVFLKFFYSFFLCCMVNIFWMDIQIDTCWVGQVVVICGRSATLDSGRVESLSLIACWTAFELTASAAPIPGSKIFSPQSRFWTLCTWRTDLTPANGCGFGGSVTGNLSGWGADFVWQWINVQEGPPFHLVLVELAK